MTSLHNVQLATYLLWKEGAFPLNQSELRITPAPGRSFANTLWPDASAWPGAVTGYGFGGEAFVDPADVGLGYSRSSSRYRY